jgi:hypothetical protein
MDYINDWAILEADFTREYAIDLTTASLSWRRFCILANGLSSNSIWVMTYKGRSEGTVAITDDAAGERAVNNVFN